MPINISDIYRQSKTKRVLDFLFLPKSIDISDSFLLNLLKKLYLPLVSEIAILVAVTIIWYKQTFPPTISPLSQPLIPLSLMILAVIFCDKERIQLKKSHLYYLIFLLIALVSGVLAALRGISPTLIISGWLLFAEFGLVYLVAGTIKEKIRFLGLLALTSLPMTAMAFYQFFAGVKTSSLWLSPGETQLNRVFGFLGSPNVLAAMLGIIIFVTLGLYFERKKIYYLLIPALNIFVIVLTFSRSAWLAFALSFLVIFLFVKPKLLFLSPILLLALISGKIRGRILTAFSPSYYFDSTLDGRIWAWINGTYILGKYPIFGTGPGTYGGQLALTAASPVYLEGIQNGYTALYFTDNQFLEILVQTGMVGFVLFLFFFISVGCELVSAFRVKHSKISLMAFGATVFFVAASVFANNLEFTAVSLPLAIFIGAVNE